MEVLSKYLNQGVNMIRKATKEDTDEILKLGFEQFIDEGSHRFGLSYNLLPSLRIWDSIIEEKGGVAYVLEVDGILQGFCMWQIISFMGDPLYPIFHETGFYIRMLERGKGWGGKFIAAGEQWAKEHGIKLVTLGTAAVGSPEYLNKYYEDKGYNLYQMLFMKQMEGN